MNLSDEVAARVAEDECGEVMAAVSHAAVERERESAAERPVHGDRMQHERQLKRGRRRESVEVRREAEARELVQVADATRHQRAGETRARATQQTGRVRLRERSGHNSHMHSFW